MIAFKVWCGVMLFFCSVVFIYTVIKALKEDI